MDKYSRYYGIIVFIIIVGAALFYGYSTLSQSITSLLNVNDQVVRKEKEFSTKVDQKKIVERKLVQIKTASTSIQKKVYSPLDSDLGNDTLFFTLYNDLIEMVRSNSIKIKSMEYKYNPEDDSFVQHGKDAYFVCEVKMELVSNYTNLGKLIQDLIQYPYYTRIMSLSVNPYTKDKKVLISNLCVRLYAHTAPVVEIED